MVIIFDFDLPRVVHTTNAIESSSCSIMKNILDVDQLYLIVMYPQIHLSSSQNTSIHLT